MLVYSRQILIRALEEEFGNCFLDLHSKLPRHFLAIQATKILTPSGVAAAFNFMIRYSSVPVNALDGLRYYQLRTTGETQVNHLSGTTVTTTREYFNSFNVPELVTIHYGQDMSVTRMKSFYTSPTGKWLPLRLQSETLIKDHSDALASDLTTHTYYTYNTSYPHRLQTKTTLQNTNKELTESMDYESFGAVKKITTSDTESSTPDRYVEFEYTGDHRFVSKKTVNGSFDVNYYYDDFGKLLKDSTYNNLNTRIAMEAWVSFRQYIILTEW